MFKTGFFGFWNMIKRITGGDTTPNELLEYEGGGRLLEYENGNTLTEYGD